MSLHFQSNKSGKMNGKGFYIALGVCLIAIGVAAWTTYDSVVKFANPEENSSSSKTQVVSQPAKETDTVVSHVKADPQPSSSSEVSSKPVESSSPSSSKPTPSAPAKPTVAPQKTVSYFYPLSSDVSKKYSGQNLVFSETMQDWRAHSGIDISAKVGDPVSAIAEGKVTNVFKDGSLGNVIVIEHAGGIEARYCGVGDTALVKKGQTVKSGQKIGSVNTVPFELVEKPHLHLEIRKNGKSVDPASVLKVQK